MSIFRRVRSYGGQFTLLAVLAMVAALLLTGTPRVANGLADAGLREELLAAPSRVRDITYQPSWGEEGPPPRISELPGQLDSLQEAMPAAVRQLIGERWYSAQTGPDGLRVRTADNSRRPGPLFALGLRAASGAQPAVKMVAGRWPAEPTDPQAPIEAALSVTVARAMALQAGDRITLTAPAAAPDRMPAHVVIVGIFEPTDAADGIWDTADGLLRPVPPAGDGQPVLAVALTTETVIGARAAAHWPIQMSWRYRVDVERLDAGMAGSVIDGVRQLQQTVPRGKRVVMGLDRPLQRFLDRLTSMRALLAVVFGGLLATLCGLVALAARLTAHRRREEFRLLRARGGSLATIAGRSAAESLLVIPLAVVLGSAAGQAMPGRSVGAGWLVAAAAVASTLALPVAALVTRPRGTGRRGGVVGVRTSLGRGTAEITIVVLAVLGAFLLRRRGLPADGLLDPLVISVPVLVAVGAAVLALRCYPWPLRLVGKLAARARGMIAFLGTARAGRSGTASGPVVVLVVAIATAVFCGVVAAGVANGRNRAAEQVVPADALLTGYGFAPDASADLAALPGVRAVTPIMTQPDQRLYPEADGRRTGLDPVLVLVVDGPTFARVLAESGVRVELPPALTGTAAGPGPVPAVVSPAVAADLPRTGFVSTRHERYEFQVAAVSRTFPAIDRSAERFLVLPWHALATAGDDPLIPTGFLVAGSVDVPALRTVGEDAQRRWLAAGVAEGGEPPQPVAVIERAAYREGLDSGGVNGLLSFAFVAGAAGGGVLGLLAVGFAVLAGARARGRVLSRLRTMGLSHGQRRGLLAYELAPLLGVASVTGAAVGALLPLLLSPVLRLSVFTAGAPVQVRFEWDVAAGVVALGALALGTAVGVEAAINRRMRLGEVLRLGEES